MATYTGWKAALTAALGKVADITAAHQITLTAPLALTVPAGFPAGQVYRVTLTQDATGGHSVTFGGNPVTVDTTAGASTLVEVWPGGSVTYPGGHTLDPVTFGADPSGVGESSSAFQQAMDRAIAGPITIKPTPGTYRVRNLRVRANTTLDLSGVTLVYGGTHGTTGPVETVPTIIWSGQAGGDREDGIAILGGTLVGGRPAGVFAEVSGPTSDDTIYLWRANAPRIVGVTIRDAGQDAVTFDDCSGGVVDRCTIIDSGDAGVDLRSGGGYTITSSTFQRVRDAVAAKPNVTDVLIADCVMSTFAAAIVAHGRSWAIQRNRITAASTPDLLLGSTASAIRVLADGIITPLDAYDITIQGNTITGRTGAYAIELVNSGAETLSRVTIEGNTVRDCNRGVGVHKGAGVTVRDNDISTTQQPVWPTGGSRVSITRNTLTSATARCVETALPDTLIQDNRCTASGSDALYLAGAATGSAVTGNHVTSAGVGITSYAVGGQVSNNTISTSAGAGVLLAGTSCVAAGNRISAAAEGVHVTGAKASVVGNTIAGGTHGVRLAASDAAATGNSVTGATYFGVNISAGSVDCVVTGNMLKGNGSGGVNDAGTASLIANNKP